MTCYTGFLRCIVLLYSLFLLFESVSGSELEYIQDKQNRTAKNLLEAAASVAQEGIIRQNQFKLNIEQGQVESIELWIVPKYKLIVVKGGSLEAEFIEKLQNGIKLSDFNLSENLAVYQGEVYAKKPLTEGWEKLSSETKPFLGFGREIQIDLSSFEDYWMKVAYWSKVLEKQKEGTAIYKEAVKNLELLSPKGGKIAYSDESFGIQITIDEKNKRILDAQSLIDGIVFYEVQNQYLSNIPSYINDVLLDIMKLKQGGTCEPFIAAIKDKEVLGMYLVPTADGNQKVAWIAPGGAAEAGGIHQGDIITQINGNELSKMTQSEVADLLSSNKRFSINLNRGSKRLKVSEVVKRLYNP